MTSTSPEPTRPTDHAWRSPRAWCLLFIVVCVGLIADLGSKRWAFENVADTPVILNRDLLLADTDYSPIPWQHVHGPGTSVLPFDLLELKLVLNRGAVFGIGPDKRYFFIGFTVIALAGGLLVFGRMTAVRHRFAHVAIGMILAGGIGNLYDRLFVGRVRDFLHMLPNRRLPFGWNWPGGNTEIFPWIFNIADVMLLAGVLLLMLHINAVEKEHHKAKLARDNLAKPGGHDTPGGPDAGPSSD